MTSEHHGAQQSRKQYRSIAWPRLRSALALPIVTSVKRGHLCVRPLFAFLPLPPPVCHHPHIAAMRVAAVLYTPLMLLLLELLPLPHAATATESCHTFGGGDVYPQTGLSSDHKLQWTKAVISKPAPDWEGTAVINGQFKEIKLSQYRGKYLIFFFYPLDFTFVCPTEILAFNDYIERFRELNTEVVACSVDSHFTHHAWMNIPRKEGGLGMLKFPLLSDLTHKISRDYGVYLEDLGHSLRGLFIIDPKGILRQITMNDLPVGRSVEEALRLVQAFQYTDQHGEVCPAGWKPGEDTIVPDPEEKKKFFGRQYKTEM